MSMAITHTMTVQDPIGLHARPVGQIVTLVRESGHTVTLQDSAGKAASATSALRMLALKVKNGDTLDIVVESDDDDAARSLAHAIEAIINEG
jgi:phosphocarrier protein